MTEYTIYPLAVGANETDQGIMTYRRYYGDISEFDVALRTRNVVLPCMAGTCYISFYLPISGLRQPPEH
jgi:hypothetical protein